MTNIYDLLGLGGVIISVICYARVQWHRDFAKTYLYSLGNVLSSLLFLVSLWHAWNLPAFVLNCTWLVLSLYGVYRCWKYDRRVKRCEAA